MPANVNHGWVERRGRQYFVAIVGAPSWIATKCWL
jgi:hypothetical protein